MQVRANTLTSAVPQVLKAAPGGDIRPAAASQSEVFGAEVPGYTGPRDGLSHPRHRWLIRPLNRALISSLYRMRVQGEKDLPRANGHVYTPTHVGTLDALTVSSRLKQDVRYMANMWEMVGLQGVLMTWGGAYPVNREHASPVTLQHTDDIIRQGKGICIFPEAGFEDQEKSGQIGPIKKGAAAGAIAGRAESVIPIALYYHPDRENRPLEAAVGLAVASAVAIAGAAIAGGGSHAAQVAANVVMGTIGGGYALGAARYHRTETKDWWNPMPKFVAMLGGAAIGGIAGGLLAGLPSAFYPHAAPMIGLATSVTGGLATCGIANAWRTRDVADILVAPRIDVKPYLDAADNDAAVDALTVEIHRGMGHAKEKLTGVPYDDNAPKFRGQVIETLKPAP